MALDLNSITRVSGANCDHFDVDYSADGTSRVVRIDKQKADTMFDNLNDRLGLPGNAKDVLMFAIIQYYLSKGYTLAQLPAKCQLPD